VTSKISARTARAQFGQIMRRAVENHERFLVERNGKPMVMILSVTDYVRTVAPPPDWLESSWDRAKGNGFGNMNSKEIDAEIAASRRERAKS
jgi:prevent-host-death family protein